MRIVTTISDRPSPLPPFWCCGEEPEVEHFRATFSHPDGYVVVCDTCGLRGSPDDSPTGAVANWNATFMELP